MGIYQDKWLYSIRVAIQFNTTDGDLDYNQYAIATNGHHYYVRTKPKEEAGWDTVEPTFDITGKTKVTYKTLTSNKEIVYDFFLSALGATEMWANSKPFIYGGGYVVKVVGNLIDYNSMGTTKNAPQPLRTEIVSILPPPEPLDSEFRHHSIAFDANYGSTFGSAVTSISWSHTCAGSNLVLVIAGGHLKNNESSPAITTATYNGDSVTKVKEQYSGNYYGAAVLCMVAPDTGGSYTVQVNFNAATSCAYGSTSVTGAAQTGQPDASNGAGSTSADNPSVTVTTILDNCWVFAGMLAPGPMSCNNTQRYHVWAACFSDTNGPKTPAGAQVMSWTGSTAGLGYAIAGLSISPDIPVKIPHTRYYPHILAH
jgi:hypothetical protein